MDYDAAEKLTTYGHWFRRWMPYQYLKLDHPTHRHLYLPLNRDYKPLGLPKQIWVNYDDHHDKAVVFARDPQGFKSVWHDLKGLYLYDDDPASRRDYFARFDRLMAHATVTA